VGHVSASAVGVIALALTKSVRGNASTWPASFESIDGTHLPFEDRSIDLSFTVTVLQHVTDAAMLEALVKDICRVTRDTVVIMEDIGQCERLGAKARASIARLAPTRADW
jgi:ubiquinone/menaquinone biosynthesis C-methylase UbiE